MRHTLTRTAGVSLLVAGLITPAIALAAAPALARTGDCHTVTITDSRALTTSGGGTAKLVDGGVIMSTPEQTAKVTYRRALSSPVPLSKVTDLSYVTDRQAEATGVESTVAAYKLGVDVNGDGTVDGVLVYEPYYNVTVTAAEQAHDALGADGSGKWWYSAEPGNKQTLATFKQWTDGAGPVAFPAPEVRWFAVEQGTWNTGAITLVSKIKFKAVGMCKIIRFDCPPPVTTPTTTKPTATATPTTTQPTSTPSTSPTTRPTTQPTTSPTTTPPVIIGGVGGGDDSLPVTGSAVAGAFGIGAVLLAAGAVLLYTTRRRRARYVA